MCNVQLWRWLFGNEIHLLYQRLLDSNRFEPVGFKFVPRLQSTLAGLSDEAVPDRAALGDPRHRRVLPPGSSKTILYQRLKILLYQRLLNLNRFEQV